jgi:hypothetical protein
MESDFEDNRTAAMKFLDHFALPPALMQPQTMCLFNMEPVHIHLSEGQNAVCTGTAVEVPGIRGRLDIHP